MTKQDDRRHFLRAAGAGIAAGVAGVSAAQAANPPADVPLPDANTQAPQPGSQTAAGAGVCACDPASTLIVAKINGNKVKEYRNLEEIWTNVGDKAAFLRYVQKSVATMLE